MPAPKGSMPLAFCELHNLPGGQLLIRIDFIQALSGLTATADTWIDPEDHDKGTHKTSIPCTQITMMDGTNLVCQESVEKVLEVMNRTFEGLKQQLGVSSQIAIPGGRF